MNDHITIVGAGPGGLASAILLASGGCRVTLVEARERVGGRTSSHLADGFRFDTGPTFFLYPEVLESIFAAAGRTLRDEIELLPVDPLYRLHFGDGETLDATDDIAELARRVARLSPADAEAVPRFFADNDRKLEAFLPFLQKAFLGANELLDPKLIRLLPTLAPWRQLDKELERYFVDPRVRMMFSFQALYLGMTPQTCPSLFSILPLIEYRYGVHHPRGGCGALMETMARVATELGVDIKLDSPVRGLHFDGRRCVGVETDDERIDADAVILNADFADAMKRLVPARLRKRWSDRRIEKQRYSCSTFMLYLGLEGRFDDQPHHTVYMPKDYRRHLDDIDAAADMTPDPAFYAQNASITDDSLAPRGHSTLYLLMPVSHQHDASRIDWAREAPVYRRLAMKQLAKVGFDDVERRIRYERHLTPTQWRDDYRIHRGATFNMAHNFGQMLHRRPRNRFEDLDGVYLVGGGTHPGSGLPTIFESAKISTALLCDELGIAAPKVPDVASVPSTSETFAAAVAARTSVAGGALRESAARSRA